MTIGAPAIDVDRHDHSRPRSAWLHLFSSGTDQFMLDVRSGKIHQISIEHAKALDMALRLGDPGRADLTALAFGVVSPATKGAEAPRSVPVRAISLAIAQKCNLGCAYCYAQQGTFGRAGAEMPSSIAKAAIDRLFSEAEPGEPLTLAFMGGEPLVNRNTLHASTKYAASEAAARGIRIRFSTTTNATLLRDEDIRLFDEYAFTLTVSLDGLRATHDSLRPYRSGKGTFEKIAENVKALLAVKERRFRMLARVTVTPRNLELPEILTGLVAMGFDAVMFSPLLSAPSANGEMHATDLDVLLEQMTACGEIFQEELRRGRILPFSNVTTTLQRINSYEREEYPCGAGGGYMGVSADGGLYACHRFVDDEEGLMGNVSSGVDPRLQARWLDNRHLDRQSPCGSCWARYLCSGSCHYEVIKRGRPACDYIRGWLTYCLRLYVELAREHPSALKAIVSRH